MLMVFGCCSSSCVTRQCRISSNTPTLQHSNTPTLQHSNTPTLQHSNTPTLQHSNTPTLQQATPVSEVPNPNSQIPGKVQNPNWPKAALRLRYASNAPTLPFGFCSGPEPVERQRFNDSTI